MARKEVEKSEKKMAFGGRSAPMPVRRAPIMGRGPMPAPMAAVPMGAGSPVPGMKKGGKPKAKAVGKMMKKGK